MRLEAIESLVDTRSDSALLLLGALRDEKMSHANRMLYELLLGKATELQRQPYTSDSVMRQVAEYYDRRGNRKRQMEAHYVLASAYLDEGQMTRAYNHLYKTLSLADTTSAQCSWKILQGAHLCMARLYKGQKLWDKTLYEDSLAEQASWRCMDTSQAIECRKNMCRILLLQQEYIRCIEKSWQLLERCRTLNRLDEGQECLVLLTESFLRGHQYREAAECLLHYNSFLSSHPDKRTRRCEAALNFCQGRLFLKRGETDSASAHFNRASDMGQIIYDKATQCHTASEVIQFDSTSDERKHGNRGAVPWAMAVLVVAALVGMSLWHRKRIQLLMAHKEENKDLQTEICRLEKQNEYLETTITGIAQQDRRREYMSSDAVQYFYKHLNAPRVYPLKGQKWLALREETERCFPTFYHRTHSGKPISETEYTLCILTKAGFTAGQINLLMEKEEYASTTRRRLLKKIFGMDGSPTNFDRRIQAIV